MEIDCPSECVHLAKGRAWEAARSENAPERPRGQFNQQFVLRNGDAIGALSQAIVDGRSEWAGMVDGDARVALEALEVTLRTLESGLHYESAPEGSPAGRYLYSTLRAVLDELMAPRHDHSGLKVSDARAVLTFLLSTHDFYASERPRSRSYLDWLATMVPRQTTKDEPDRLILP